MICPRCDRSNFSFLTVHRSGEIGCNACVSTKSFVDGGDYEAIKRFILQET